MRNPSICELNANDVKAYEYYYLLSRRTFPNVITFQILINILSCWIAFSSLINNYASQLLASAEQI